MYCELAKSQLSRHVFTRSLSVTNTSPSKGAAVVVKAFSVVQGCGLHIVTQMAQGEKRLFRKKNQFQ